MPSSTNTRGVLFHAALCFVAAATSLSQAARPTSATAQLQNAARELSAGKLGQAGKDLQSILDSNPEDYRALDLLGVVRVLEHQEPQAEELFEQAVKAEPDFAPGHAHIGLLYLHLGRTQEAVAELKLALRLDPARADAAGALVHFFQDQAKAESEAGNWNAALGSLMEARNYAPDDADVQYEFGLAARKLSLDDDAIEAFQQSLKLRKNDPAALYNLGFAWMDRARFDDARRQFTQYVELRPNDASGHCALGMALAALERSAEARAQLERSIELDSTQSESYYRLGLLDMDAGDYDAAERELRNALQHKAGDAGALTALGRIEFEQKHYAQAITLLKQALSQDDSLEEAHYCLGLSLARLGSTQESNEQLQVAARLEQEQKDRSRNMLRIRKPDAAGKPEPGPQQ